MRPATGLAIVALVLLFVWLGWKALGIIAAAFALLVLLPMAAIAVGILMLRRRMRRNLRRLQEAMQEQVELQAQAQRADRVRREAIDVEGEVRRR